MYTSRIDKFIREFSDIQLTIERYFNVSSDEKEKITQTAEKLVKKYRTDRSGKKFDRMINYLDKKGFIVKNKIGGKKMIFITPEGMKRSLAFSLRNSQKEKRKDGKLILLVFDVPEKSRSIRYLLRSVLHNLGYRMVQQSVWASSYDVLEETKRFIDLYFLSSYAKIFLSEKC